MDDTEILQRASALYRSVEAEASRFAAVSTLTLEDVRQSLYTMCLERSTGVDKYDARLGDPRTYVLGRMWGMVERWRGREVSLQDEDEPDEGVRRPVPAALHSLSVEDELIEAEQRRVMEAVRLEGDLQECNAMRHLPSVVALIRAGAVSEREATRLCGSDSGRMRQRWRALRKQGAGSADG
ncbi:hypothetical protein [Thiomonas intermedia]|uniref:hypothetical protein n=1 Tax=Thiomonas intermedia TaxID=926 RepID=UPI0009A51FCB|nr:hypothetical protein [Thiomonas intermedia]